MAQTGYTPISIYYSATTTNVPTAGNLVAGELAINTQDGKLFYKDAAGVVQTLASKDANSGTFVNLAYTGTLTGGTGVVNLGSGQFYKDASGNVGIGTSSPAVKLQVTTSGVAALPPTSGTTPSTGELIRLRTSSDSAGGIGTIGLAINQMWLQATDATGLGTGYQLLLNPNGGNVGIGTASPAAKLQVSGTTDTPVYVYTSNANNFLQLSNSTNNFYLGAVGANCTFTVNGSERMRIDSSGNVGIGTTTPYSATGAKTIQLTGADYSIIEQSATTATSNYSNWRQIVRGSVASHVWQLQLMNDANNAEQTVYEVSRAANSVTFQRWFGGTTEALRLTSSGDLGIGTNNPQAKLDVNGQMQAMHVDASGFAYRVVANTGNTNGSIQWTNNAGSADWGYIGATAANKVYWTTAVGDTTQLSQSNIAINGGVINMRKVASSGGDIGDWPMPVLGMQNYDSNFHGITMMIMGGKNDDTSYQTGSAVWNWRLWDTTPTSGWTTSSASTMCSLAGPGVLTMTSDTNGVQLTNGATAWAAYSDERMKDIIEPITDAAAKVSTLRAVIGKYKTDEDGIRRPMLIAQDVQAVLPEAVTETAYMPNQGDLTKPAVTEQRLALAYTEVIPLLVAAIKEQQETITSLTSRINALEGK